jgi:hypothetical protein
MPSNRELLIAQRNKDKKKGFVTPATTFKKDTSRRTGRVTPKKTGQQGIQQRAADLVLEEGTALKGMKTEGAAIAKEFPGLRPGKKTGATGIKATSGGFSASTTEGDILSPTGKKQIESGFGSEISTKQRKSQGLGEFTPGRGGGGGGFGLPSDRLPTFNELGGAIGQMFKFVSGVSKKRQALGLIPGKIQTSKQGLGLTQNQRATILAKQLDDIGLPDEKRTEIRAELDAIINPAGTQKTDIDAILKG